MYIESSDVMTLEHDDATVTSILTLENVTMDYEGNYSCSVAYSDQPDIQSTSETATLQLTTISETCIHVYLNRQHAMA